MQPNVFELKNLNGFWDVESFYRNIGTGLAARQSNNAVFDFHALEFLRPEATLALVCASKYWHTKTGTAVEWQIEDENMLCYLERIDVFAACADCITPARLPTEAWSRGASLNLMEICTLSEDIRQNNLVDIQVLLANAQKLLLGNVTRNRVGATCTVLSEVSQNVTHSGTEGYALMQVYKVGTDRRVHIAVGDIGCGIPTSLRTKYPGSGHPSDYLALSLKSGVSARDGANGLGLYQVQQLVAGKRGTLTIRSDTAMLQISASGHHQWDGLAHFPGTQVFITLWGHDVVGEWEYLLPIR